MVLDYKTMKVEDIIEYCVAHKETEWLKETAAKTIATKNREGELSERKITFIELKLAFVEKFMPEIAPEKKPKKPTMYELIANL